VFKQAEAKKGAKQAAKAASKNDYVKIEISEKSRPSLYCTKARFETLKSKLHVKNTNASTYTLGTTGYSVQITRDNVLPLGNKSNSVEIYHEELSRVCEEYFETNEEIRRMVGVLYNRYLAMLEGLSPSLEQIERFVTNLDVVCCKSILARKYNYCRPRVCEEAPKAFVRARDLRHPIIELLQENEEYVANDVELGAGSPDGILLYGVNMAGKTSFIRALGMSVIMAQAGLYVPAASFEFKPYNYIFTRIIGNDNLFKGLSTFAVEMVELKTILTMSNQDSLVLGDEVCSGTETVSACSIFVSALKQLTGKNASYVFATHLHEIVDFEEIVEMKTQTIAIKHMDVRYDATRGSLVYNRKLLEGSGSKMYGLEVCKSLHMPRAFLEEANSIRLKYFSTIENDSLLDQRVSSYNSKKVVGLCEKCQLKQGTEVHHIAQQKDADEFGYVLKNGKRIHKNNLQNLMTVCERCHREIHHSGGGGGGGSVDEPSVKHKKLK
jgi:DNA mismatch repair protein MutS